MFSFVYCLFIKCLVVCAKLILPKNASLPPSRDETTTISHQLDECGADAQHANLHTLVLSGAVDAQRNGVEEDEECADAT